MGYLGLSLLLVSVVYVIIRPPTWLLPRNGGSRGAIAPAEARDRRAGEGDNAKTMSLEDLGGGGNHAGAATAVESRGGTSELRRRAGEDKESATPAPPSISIVQPSDPPAIQAPDPEPESPTTPKASAAMPPPPVPSFSLTDTTTTSSSTSSSKPADAASLMMPPPPLPSTARAPQARVPSLAQFPAPNSAQRARGPAPNRNPAAASSNGLAPPPTHTSKPAKPSRKVLLTPGHSPLDWARISGPNADLRGIPPSTPYLRVTPSMLKRQNGRKGVDAWMAINGKVYNVTPYAKFHPGGVPELMRGAAKDGTKLFGEVHPWVNYETMLAACLVGLLVEEPEGGEHKSEMDEMD